jgi:hypothetical protein
MKKDLDLQAFSMVGGTWIEHVTPSVSRKCSPTELTARADLLWNAFSSSQRAASALPLQAFRRFSRFDTRRYCMVR